MAIIEISNMEFYAYHGCFDEESMIGTRFRVSLRLSVDSCKAQMSDDIADTVNYLDVYQEVKKQMSIPSHLLEHVAERIATAILTSFPVQELWVKVTKLNPPLGGKIEGVSVELSKSIEALSGALRI